MPLTVLSKTLLFLVIELVLLDRGFLSDISLVIFLRPPKLPDSGINRPGRMQEFG